jgi:hypothetical protein
MNDERFFNAFQESFSVAASFAAADEHGSPALLTTPMALARGPAR